jgi:predicted phosphodiesterase
LIDEARRLGYWKLVSRVFTFNQASRALCAACGFREVGVYEKHGQLDGRWLDCVIVERLIGEHSSEGRKTMMERFAVMSDIHGNTWALDAVLADVKRRGITEIINLGDSVYGSLDPAGTVDRLIAAAAQSISGNQDRILGGELPEVRGSRDYQFVTSQLGEERLRYMTSLPPTLVIGDIFACHGTPEADDIYLLETVTEDGFGLSDTDRVLGALKGVGQGLILCGHSHLSRTVMLPTGQLVVNPGSVGIPAYTDDLPYFHRVESGSPHARYAVVTRGEAGWSVEHVALPYAWREAADMARRQGRADRARWIETGRA